MAAERVLWQPTGSRRDDFVLMLHDRIVELEAKVARVEPAVRDPALLVLGAATVSDSGAVFVRIRTSRPVDTVSVMDAILRRLGTRDTTRWDAWACCHWSCLLTDKPYVTEMLVQRSSATRTVDVVAVGHAAVDAAVMCMDDASICLDGSTRSNLTVDACAVKSPHWFIESIRIAAACPGGRSCSRAWDPAARAPVATAEDDATTTASDDDDVFEQAHRTALQRMHGWLATQLECTDLWHPRAPCAAVAAASLECTLARALVREQQQQQHLV